MTDLDLLLLGTAVSFIAAGGGYVFLRERFTARDRSRARIRERTRRQKRRVERAA